MQLSGSVLLAAGCSLRHPANPRAFYLFGAQRGYPLFAAPKPTHDFPQMHRPEVRFPNDDIAWPVRAEAGTAPFKFVTIDDAISDLPRFNWCESFHSQCSLLHRLSDDLSRIKKTYSRINPSLSRLPAQKQNEVRQRAVHIPAFECDEEKPYVGFSGAARYHDAPRTTFQAWCRENQTEDLQHFTRTLKATTVERYALPAHGKYGCTDAD